MEKYFKSFLVTTAIVGPLIIMVYYFVGNRVIVDDDVNKSNIVINSDLLFDYYEVINLSDIIIVNNGTLIDSVIATYNLGEDKTEYLYKIGNKTYKGFITYEVVDVDAPIIFGSTSYQTKKGNDIDFLSSIMVIDNHDKRSSCYIDGEYDVNSIGSYQLSILCSDISGNTSNKEFVLHVKSSISSSSYEAKEVYFSDIYDKHKSDNTRIGIDVSHWQGDINWTDVKNSGVEFAIIRTGYAPGNEEDFFLDTKFIDNLKGAKDAGIDVGLYYFSYARSVDDVIKHANYIIDLLDGENLELPISFDWENWSKFNNYELSVVDLNNMAKSFIDTVEDSGYTGMNYGSAYYLRSIWNKDMLTWLAHYTDDTSYEYEYYMWQLTDSGVVDGINGPVDINVLYE